MKKSPRFIIFKLAIILIAIILSIIVFELKFKILFKTNLKNDIEVEHTQVLTSSDISNDIFCFLKNIDTTIFSVLSIYDDIEKGEVSFSIEQKLDIANAYIIQNLGKYQSEIKNVDKNYIYMEDDTAINSLGFVDKSLIEKIVFEIFGECDIILYNYKFYDTQTDMVALVPLTMYNTRI